MGAGGLADPAPERVAMIVGIIYGLLCAGFIIGAAWGWYD